MRITAKKRKDFIANLAETGNVALSARMVNLPKHVLYDLRRKDGDFASAWDDALEAAVDLLEAEARRRAVKGVEEPVFYRGEQVGVVTRYSDNLLVLLLKAHRPEKFANLQKLDAAFSGKMELCWQNDDE